MLPRSTPRKGTLLKGLTAVRPVSPEFPYNGEMFWKLLGLPPVLMASVALAGCSSESLTDASPGSSAPGGPDGANAAPRSDPPAAPYPNGPYGRGVGAVISNLSFLGWRNGDTPHYDPNRLEVVSLSDYYNPDGSGPVRLIALNSSAVWCTVCRAEYIQLERDGVYAEFKPKGVEILGVLFEDAEGDPAKPADLSFWGGSEGLRLRFPLVLDPGFTTGTYFSTDATPMNMLIDTRTMQILDITMGYDTTQPEAYWSKIEQWLGR